MHFRIRRSTSEDQIIASALSVWSIELKHALTKLLVVGFALAFNVPEIMRGQVRLGKLGTVDVHLI